MKDIVIGIKYNNDTVKVSTGGAKVLSESFATSPFITKNKWESGKVRLFHVNGNQSTIFQDVSSFGEVNRIAFVGYAGSSKQDKITEELHLKEQFDVDTSVNNDSLDNQNRARDAAFAALKALLDDDREVTVSVLFDDFDGAVQSVAEGAYLASYQFYLDEKKEQELKKTTLSLIDESNVDEWNKGKIISLSQNFARWLEELPANYCTPTKFCEYATKRLEGTNITINVHDQAWAKERNMNSFLSVSSGSDEPPKVFEAVYLNNPNKKSDEIDLVFVGKGVCFDSGGYSLKPGPDMKLMKADMGGSATVVASLLAIAQLNLPLNVVAITMMVENMINGKATRPGDVITASNGKTIEIDNTDAEGRLALADGLVYASKTYKPEYLVDAATLTGAIGVALGAHCAGCFTSSNKAWKLLERAGYETNEYFWRMPLFRAPYRKQLKALSADLNNIGGAAGGSCTAAAFLCEFVDFESVKNYVHLDIAKVVIPTPSECGTGRPTRAIVRFAELLASKK